MLQTETASDKETKWQTSQHTHTHTHIHTKKKKKEKKEKNIIFCKKKKKKKSQPPNITSGRRVAATVRPVSVYVVWDWVKEQGHGWRRNSWLPSAVVGTASWHYPVQCILKTNKQNLVIVDLSLYSFRAAWSSLNMMMGRVAKIKSIQIQFASSRLTNWVLIYDTKLQAKGGPPPLVVLDLNWSEWGKGNQIDAPINMKCSSFDYHMNIVFIIQVHFWLTWKIWVYVMISIRLASSQPIVCRWQKL